MLSACKKPFPTHGCGQCEYCRVMEKMDKVNRLKLEHGVRPYAFFITLTYSDEFLPLFSGLPNLWRPDLVSYIDRIRNKLPKFTVFAVGEYGGRLFGSPEAEREIHPHYHLAVFSSDPSIREKIREVCTDKWRYGHCHILLLSSGLIDYITGYVSKKLTNEFSMRKVMGLDISPEFTYSSRRPAIGDVSEQLIDIQESHGEITHLELHGKRVVIPRYLRYKMRDILLRWDLNLKEPRDRLEYERRKYEKKLQNLQELREKEDAQDSEIEARTNISGDLYKKRSQIRRQIVATFENKFNLRKQTKGIKVL